MEAVKAHSEAVLSWHELEEGLLKMHQLYTQSLEAIANLEDTLAEERVEFQLFKDEVAATEVANEVGENRPLATRERESLDSILLVGAIREYGFDPARTQ